MADVITRLRLESGEFDGKVKRAVQGLQRMEEECRSVGGTLAILEKDQREYIGALGQMETVSKTVKGRLGELTAAYTELRVQYERLTEEEKKGDFGKALSASLEQLRGRIGETKGQLAEVGKELGNTSQEGGRTGGVMDALSKKFTINVDALTLLGKGLSMTKSVLGTVKDAFFASEQNIDDWGRMTRSAGDIYEGFLTAINTGDISGYLSRIDEIAKAAREAYDELDRLSTQKAINNGALKGQQTENERMRTMLRTGRYIAPADGRANASGLVDGQKLTQAQLNKIAANLSGGQKRYADFIKADIEQAGKAIGALYNEQAKILGLTKEEFMRGTSNMSEFNRRIEGYKDYMKFEREHTTVQQMGTWGTRTIRDGAVNPHAAYRAWGVFKDDGKLFSAINENINQRAALESQYYSAVGSNYRAINKATRGGSGGGSHGGGTVEYEPKTVVLDVPARGLSVEGVSTGWEGLTEDENMRNSQLAWLKGAAPQSIGGLEFGSESEEVRQWRRQQVEDYDRKSRNKFLHEDENGDFTASLKETGDAIVGGLSGITDGLETLGIEVPAGMKKGLAVLQAISGIISSIQTITMAIQALTAADTIIPLARGGVVRAATGTVVPGNWGYDAVPALLTSGEVVLNRAQQGNLASQLEHRDGGRGGSEGGGSPYVSGEMIYLGLSNFLRRSGRGELVTARG